MVKIRESLTKLFSKQNVEIVKTGAESAKAVIELGKAIQQNKATLKEIQPYLGQISSLLDVLNSPWAQVVKEAIPFAPLAMTLLNLTCEHLKRELSLEECILVVAEAAYMKSWQVEFERRKHDLFKDIDLTKESKQIDRNFKKLGELGIDRDAANQIITALPSSKLVKEFNEILIDRLVECGIDWINAMNFAERVAMGAPRYMNEMVAENAKKIEVLAEIYRNGGKEAIAHYASIDRYLAEKIAPLPLEHVFSESDLQLQDIYVPLEIQPLNTSGEETSEAPRSIREWAIEKLLDPRSNAILFIQGEAGRGKSVFCRMFADLVRRELAFTPILIRLREILNLGDTLTETLEKHLENFNFTKDKSWLSNENQRFLFLLDGFDELILQGKSRGLKEFIEQVEKFQQGSHHRILITGRPLAMQGIEKSAFRNKCLERVKFLPMNDEIRTDWLNKWRVKFGLEETDNFVHFLNACHDDIRDNLAREPLILYVMARIHRDGAITAADLSDTSGMGAKVKVYDRTIAWVLEKQREDLNQKISNFELEIDELRQLLTEVSVCAIQSGNEMAKVTTIEDRLTKDPDRNVKELFDKIRGSATNNKKIINNLLTTFYIQPARADRNGSVEFAHKSFGEFLFAERIKEAICDWSIETENRRGKLEDRIKQPDLEWQIYDLLGSSYLTPDIVDYLREMLHNSTEWQPLHLFERLNEFWENWCDGEFIDRSTDNLPQKKMNALAAQMPDREMRLGIRQVDVFTGLNVLILLLELHRYAQNNDELKDAIVFYPSGEAPSDGHTTQLAKIIHYSNSFEISTFAGNAGFFLSGANLSGADLYGADLLQANLSGAKLIGADLGGANLDSANLGGANLSSALISRGYLSGANLNGADLSGADLGGAMLIRALINGANLSGANLSGADLNGAYLGGADLSDAHLGGAHISDANLIQANLSGADLNGAYLGGAKLILANLGGADLSHANLIDANLSSANLSGANLSSANFYNANLSSANLSGANLSDANLYNANLSDANLSGANLYNANLIFAKLIGADLSGAKLIVANLIFADLSSAKLMDAHLSGANLSSANLYGANLSGAKLIDANLRSADLRSADLSGADLSSADLRSADLSGADLSDVQWNNLTNWREVKGLETANLSAELKQHIDLHNSSS